MQLRCSGEKTGCVRCETIGQECIYVESRVGKVRGVRRRYKTQNTARDSSNHSPQRPPTSNNATESNQAIGTTTTTSSNNTFDPVLSAIFDDSFFGLDIPTEHRDDDFMDFENQEPLTTELVRSSLLGDDNFSSNFDYQVNGQDSALQETSNTRTTNPINPPTSPSNQCSMLGPPVRSEGHRQDYSQLLASSLTEHHPGSRHSGQCIIECVGGLQYPADRGFKELFSLDDVLGCNRKAICDISKLMASEEFQRSSSCHLIAIIAILQIVVLFEAACADFQVRNLHFCSPELVEASETPSCKSMPCLALGSFQLDSEEQLSLMSVVVSNALQCCLTTLQKLGVYMKSENPTPTLVVVEAWYHNLQRRLRALIAIVQTSQAA
jgi:hypothetical protein